MNDSWMTLAYNCC